MLLDCGLADSNDWVRSVAERVADPIEAPSCLHREPQPTPRRSPFERPSEPLPTTNSNGRLV